MCVVNLILCPLDVVLKLSGINNGNMIDGKCLAGKLLHRILCQIFIIYAIVFVISLLTIVFGKGGSETPFSGPRLLLL